MKMLLYIQNLILELVVSPSFHGTQDSPPIKGCFPVCCSEYVKGSQYLHIGNIHSLESVRLVQKIELKLLLFCTIWLLLYLHKLTIGTLILSQWTELNESLNESVLGSCLNPLKCLTAWFTSLGGRLALLFSEYIESLLESLEQSAKYTKQTVQMNKILLTLDCSWAVLTIIKLNCLSTANGLSYLKISMIWN